MSTKRQKYKTRQVRVLEEWHRIFKLEAAERNSTISKCLASFFEENHPKAKKHGEPNTK